MKKYTAREIVNGLFDDPLFLKSLIIALLVTFLIVGLACLGGAS